MTLPIFSIREEFCAALLKRGAVVLTAPTGSGKSTQVPRFLAELREGRILVLQPRRLAARMLAERVAQECGSPLGEYVGFQTRYERVFSASTRILFVTEGILTRMLLGEGNLSGISCVVFDEFHERSLNTDLGLAMTQELRRTRRPDLGLVVMSATMDAKPVSHYLDDAPVISADGRLFPVEITHCDQKTKMLGPAQGAARALRECLASGAEGDILIFMPGGYEIRKTIECCSQTRYSEPLEFLPLYGDLPPAEQRRVMEPSSRRKVIVATNIAETSLTIPGVRHVIDSGLARVSHYDAVRGVNALVTEGIARDAAEQRAGRAGREAPGTCRRLWTWLEQSARPSRTTPEVLRVDLAEAVLAVHAFGYQKPEEFPWFASPPQKMVDGAEKLLRDLGFLDKDGKLTPLGEKLSLVPAHPRIAKLLWLGEEEGCFEETAWAAALLSERPLITGSTSTHADNTERRQQVRKSTQNSPLPSSDFLVQIQAVLQAEKANFAPDFCAKLGIHPGAARDVARAARNYRDMGRKMHWGHNDAPDSTKSLLQCVFCAFPDRLARRLDSGSLVCLLSEGRRAELSAESVVRDERLFVACELRECSARGGQPGSRNLLSLCSGVEEEWLLDFFPESWTETDETFWDERRQQVVRHQTLSCLGVLLEDKLRTDVDGAVAGEILAEQLLKGKEPIPGWGEEVQRWIDRVAWVAELYPEENLPAYDEAGRKTILQNLCAGESSLKQLKGKDTLAFVKNLLTWKQQQFVNQMAPEHLLLPSGRKMKLHYTPGQQAKGSARITDLYDLPDLPVIAGGRAKVLLDILAPNYRTVQITDDLANFWKELYPKIKPELARRYPRHPWR